jgi:hypothetical protein
MGWVIKAMLRPFYQGKKPGTPFIGGCVGPRDGLDGCEKLDTTGTGSPDGSARSELLY